MTRCAVDTACTAKYGAFGDGGVLGVATNCDQLSEGDVIQSHGKRIELSCSDAYNRQGYQCKKSSVKDRYDNYKCEIDTSKFGAVCGLNPNRHGPV